MSGHSKWSTIKRKKAANDSRRGQIFTRLAREIAIAAREGGGDPETNFTLRLAMDRARTANMPKDNIDRAIRRGTGEDKSAGELERILYEGYGPHGVAMLIEVITDNRNRTVAELRHTLSKAGGNMAETGAVLWQFHRSAYFYFKNDAMDPDQIFEQAVEAGADDVVFDGKDVEIFAPFDAFKEINDHLTSLDVRPEEAELRMIPNVSMALERDQAVQVLRLIENLEDLDDVQQVYSTLDVTEEAVDLLQTA
jgi:YebC/PmpR family DNA-binding regulatory protein